ncbi:shikimate dehydrogenase family protein [Jannaschia donghaensis]|uniref:Quinate/shikimate dehydrogenase n=1 Tax=Jannaschia donghaensis TaxID=420998 RepID=A0A0M6YKM7_9RHOB|nr:hypothetical protein [Jannaschia donghaensis]CTQ50369.1 Quinate/shikimate dehydrogenase [Jannaschia donghaensis]
MKTLTCGLIGENIGASRLSRALGIMCADHGIDLTFTAIDTLDMADFDFDAQVDILRHDGWTGVTVTHPWKTLAADWAGDTMVPGTETLGASNTLTFSPLAGHNTDYTGFLAAFTHVLDRPPGSVAVAGAGGVARAIVPALISLGAGPVHVWDRNMDAARDLAARTGAIAVDGSDAAEVIADAEGLANCTPVGMAPHGGTPFDATLLDRQAWAFDAVYTPTATRFLNDARAAGLAVLTGFDLFRFMALESFAAYTGIAPDRAATLPKLDMLRPG